MSEKKPAAPEAASSSAPVTSPAAPFVPTPITIKSLLEAGAHFGHQTQRWNPKMLPYIYAARNGIHIINLDITMRLWLRARKYIVDTASRGGSILIVATKQQAREIVEQEGKRSGAFYVTQRWLGGTLTNFDTIKRSIDRMRKLEEYIAKSELPGSEIKLKKKEKLVITREIGKLESSLGGIRNMRKLPELVFVIDIQKEAIAVAESRRLHIPVIGLVDTNVDPTTIQFPIPSNDDAARTLQLYVAGIADAVIEGRGIYESRRGKDQGGDSHAAMATEMASAASPA